MNPTVVIVGGGFGGLYAAKALARWPIQVTLIDRKNHHTFQPLLYQVATAALSPAEIAVPIRRELRRWRNVEVLLGEVVGLDLERRSVKLRDRLELSYDYLILATGATHHYFGHDEWARYAPGLKTVEDALEIRRRVLLAFELAEKQAATGAPHQALNFVVIGGGPTGVELAGTLAEVARTALPCEFRHINLQQTRILLLEAGPRVLPTYPENLSQRAEQQLCDLGVEVHTNSMVTSVEHQVRVGDKVISLAGHTLGCGSCRFAAGEIAGRAPGQGGACHRGRGPQHSGACARIRHRRSGLMPRR